MARVPQRVPNQIQYHSELLFNIKELNKLMILRARLDSRRIMEGGGVKLFGSSIFL